jgi:hypothetical protein
MDDASLRASDADREQALVALREHMLPGRLTLEEFCERADAALQATVGHELAHLQKDLPAALTQAPDSRRRPARFTAALLGRIVRRGRFRLRRWALAASVFGDLDLDLRDATVEEGQAAVTAERFSNRTTTMWSIAWERSMLADYRWSRAGLTARPRKRSGGSRYSSAACAIQPATRAIAKIAVAASGGIRAA